MPVLENDILDTTAKGEFTHMKPLHSLYCCGLPTSPKRDTWLTAGGIGFLTIHFIFHGLDDFNFLPLTLKDLLRFSSAMTLNTGSINFSVGTPVSMASF